MDLQNVLIVAVAVITLFFGVFIFFRDTTSKPLKTSFLLLTMSLSLWSVFKLLFIYINDPQYLKIIIPFLYATPYFIPIFFLYFSYMFSTKYVRPRTHKRLVTTLSLISIIGIALIFFTDLVVTGYTTLPSGIKEVTFGMLYGVYVIYFPVAFLASYFFLFHRYLISSDKNLKSQILNLIIGTILTSSVAMTTNLFLPWLGNSSLNWVGNISNIIFVIFLFYSVFRYHLFNLRLITIELFVIFILIILLGELFLVENIYAFLVKIFTLIAVSVFGYIVIRSAHEQNKTHDQNLKLTEYLRRANTQLVEFDRLKTEFVSIASHQLRTPITGIKGYSSLILEESFGKVPKKIREAVEKIFKSSSLMADSVQEFLDVSKIEQGQMPYNYVVGDLKELIKTIEGEQEPIANSKGLAFGVTLNDKEDYIVKADFGKLKQAITNLVDNSVRYTLEGSITITLTKDASKHKILISIEDTGIGIPKDEIPTLFDKFVRARNAYDVSINGTGLGLFIAQEMIEAHKGKIWVESGGIDKGSTFFIELDEFSGE